MANKFVKNFKWIFVFLSLVFIAGVISLNFVFPIKNSEIVNSEAIKNEIDANLIYAVIWTESKFNETAVSNKGARGLMQLMPSTAKWCATMLDIEFDESYLFKKEYNIKLGAFYLSYLIDKYGENDALIAYNAGEGNLSAFKKGEKEIFKETREYVKRVNLAKSIYKFKNNY